jgi:hypothetical protein
MLPVEAEVRLAVMVRSEGMEVNDLAAWAFAETKELAAQIMADVLWQMQEQHLDAVLNGEREIVCIGCGVVGSGPKAVLRRGSRPRKVRTSSGPVRFRLRQVTCPDCSKTWSPFPELLGLEPGQRIAEEFARRLIDWVTELSYAKTCRLSREWLGDAPSPKTLHAHVQQRGEAVEFTEAEPLKVVLSDGTKVPAGDKPRGEDLTVAFQIQGRRKENGRPAVQKRVVGMGIGYGSWQEALATASEPELIVTDAETGVRELVADYYPDARHQLCEWHVPYTLAHTLGIEGMAVEERKELARELSGVLAQRKRKAMLTFIDALDGYPKAQGFLRSVDPYVMYTPRSRQRTTSLAERQMREINRRTDVGARWTTKGVANLMRLRLAKRHNPDDYERLWKAPKSCDSTLVPQA